MDKNKLLDAGRKKLQQFRQQKGGGKSSSKSSKQEAHPVHASAAGTQVDSGSGVESDRKECGVSGLEQCKGGSAVIEEQKDWADGEKKEEVDGFAAWIDDNHDSEVGVGASSASSNMLVSGMDDESTRDGNGMPVMNEAMQESTSSLKDGTTVETRDVEATDGDLGMEVDGAGEHLSDIENAASRREPREGFLEGQTTSLEEKVERLVEGNSDQPASLQDIPYVDSKAGLTAKADKGGEVDGGVGEHTFVADNVVVGPAFVGDGSEGHITTPGEKLDEQPQEEIPGEPSTSEEICGPEGGNCFGGEEEVKQVTQMENHLFVADVTVESDPMGEVLREWATSTGDEVSTRKEEDSFIPVLESNSSIRDLFSAQVENLRSHLYKSYVEKDFLHLVLDEQTQDFGLQSSEEVTRLRDLIKETEKHKAIISEEFMHCQPELECMSIKNTEIESCCFSTVESVENIKYHLYLTCVLSDLMQLQLAEQTQASQEFYQRSSIEVSRLLDLVKETQHSKEIVSKELADCRAQFHHLAIRNEELERYCLSSREEVEVLDGRVCQLQSELELSQEDLVRVSAELAECRGSLETLQKEKLELTASLSFKADAKEKLKEDKDLLSQENLKLTSELSENKARLEIVLDKQVLLDINLTEIRASFEQLMEENLYLSSSSEAYKSMLKEVADKYSQLPIKLQEAECPFSSSHVGGLASDNAIEGSTTDALALSSTVAGYNEKGPFLQNVEGDYSDISDVLGVLNGRLEEAEIALQTLENSIQGMQSHAVLATKSGGRAVSKLIQAFESKQYHEDNDTDAVPLIVEERLGLSYEVTRELTSNLGDMLKCMKLDLGSAELCLVEERNSRKLSKHLEVEFEAQREQNNALQAKFDELAERELTYKSRIDDLQNQLNEVEQNATIEAERLLSAVELFQKELNDRASVLQQEWNSIEVAVSEASKKVNASIGLSLLDNLDCGSCISALVNAATETIDGMHEKIEAAHLNHNKYEQQNKLILELQERNKLAVNALHKIHGNLKSLIGSFCQDTGSADLDATDENLLQFLPLNCEMLLVTAHDLLDDLVHVRAACGTLELELFSRNEKIEEQEKRCNNLTFELEELHHAKIRLESVLMKKNNDIKEFSSRCLSLSRRLECYGWNGDSDATSQLAGDDEVTAKPNNIENDLFMSVLSHLEHSTNHLIQKYEESMEQINLSKNCLHEINMLPYISADSWSLPLPNLLKKEFVPKVIEMGQLLEKAHFLGASNVQLENELLILKEKSNKLQAALEAAHSELQSKASELEQSEQRLSSMKEKLSIAVAKGKGLIVQRDSLKQFLMEKSSELEKCEQELLSKETLLREAEAKLKSCSEVERVEALESELSYIRNSATALRDSFLLKDSVLQRIEEALEDLDLPEDFHSKDIVDKVEMLARLVVGSTPFPINDSDQKSSVDSSQNDIIFMGMDALNDGRQQSSDLWLDELKRKYRELQSRFYGLAEQNDMLEQSLMERNSLVHKWEEVLDSIDMPSQLRILEPGDKLSWLARSLSEAQCQRDSLQLKIEKLELSSEMLIADLEKSQGKISELSDEVLAINSEKQIFFESLDKLRIEYRSLSDKTVQHEVDKENLQKELTDLKKDLSEEVAEKDHRIETEVQKLHELVCSALPQVDISDALTGTSGIDHLEGLIRKLVDKYIALSAEKPMSEVADKELVMDDNNLVITKNTSEGVQGQKEQQDLMAVKLELDMAQGDLNIVKEERDAAIEKFHALATELDTLSMQEELLQEENTAAMERYQSLISELDAVVKQREVLREQLTQEEQKSASIRDKLNVAVRKGKGLLQQRDSLKQTIDEMNIMVEHLKAEHNQRIDAIESERLLAMNKLAVSEQNLQDIRQTLSVLQTALHAVDVKNELGMVDPVQKMEGIGKLVNHVKSSLVSYENEARKSKRAVELLQAELNEVHERADFLQEELANKEATLLECTKQKDTAEVGKNNAILQIKQLTAVHSEEMKKQTDNWGKLTSAIDQLTKGYVGLSSLLTRMFSKDMDLFNCVEIFMEAILKQMNGEKMSLIPLPVSGSLLSGYPTSEEESGFAAPTLDLKAENLGLADGSLCECIREYDDLVGSIHKHFAYIDQQARRLYDSMGIALQELTSHKELSDSLGKDINACELMLKEREMEIHSLRGNLSLLFEACSNSILEIQSREAPKSDSSLLPLNHISGKSHIISNFPNNVDKHYGGHGSPFTEAHIRSLTNTLLSMMKNSISGRAIDKDNERELNATVLDLRRELQEKDIQMNSVSQELVSQIKEAESVGKRYLADLDSSRNLIDDLEKQVEALDNERKYLELRFDELKVLEVSSEELEHKIRSLTDALSAKDQEIDALMQALDEEESQMEILENKKNELEYIVQEKNIALENLEASRAKALAKLSTTVSKFDELHDLSESLLSEMENLQSQLQVKDSEISFLRQEVTRCTNDVLAAEVVDNKHSLEVNELLKWMEVMASRFGVHQMHFENENSSQIHAYIKILEKNIANMMAELDDTRLTAQSNDALLQIERVRVEDLLHKVKITEASLKEKETQIQLFHGGRDSSRSASISSTKHLEVEPVLNKVASTVTPHVRGARKAIGDQIAIAIDNDQDDNVLNEDDDKAHGFKALTMSRMVPRITRPIVDRIDAIWVSGDRLLMRQPALRLGVIVYWIMLHALLASII